jgi:hypothetical protein
MIVASNGLVTHIFRRTDTFVFLMTMTQGNTVNEAAELAPLWACFFFVYGFSIVWVVGVKSRKF